MEANFSAPQSQLLDGPAKWALLSPLTFHLAAFSSPLMSPPPSRRLQIGRPLDPTGWPCQPKPLTPAESVPRVSGNPGRLAGPSRGGQFCRNASDNNLDLSLSLMPAPTCELQQWLGAPSGRIIGAHWAMKSIQGSLGAAKAPDKWSGHLSFVSFLSIGLW